jgi:hypothetical protein
MFASISRPSLGFRLAFCLVAISLLRLASGVTLLAQSAAPASTAPGGFVESASSRAMRAVMTPAQIQAMLPQRGTFTFPAPYNTQGVRLTNSSDCAGADCVYSVGYSYWRNINNHAGSDTMLIFLSLSRGKGGVGPSLFSYNKVTGATSNLGPIFDSSSPFSWATGEGWYFSATMPHALYANVAGTSTFHRVDVVTHTTQQIFDIAPQFGSDKYVWQPHSSNDDKVHSFTMRSHTDDAMLGCGVYNEATAAFAYFPKIGTFDECQIDKGGRYLMIKEHTGLGTGADDDNVIVDLQTGTQTTFFDVAGAVGHSDDGVGYVVGEDNYYNLPGAVRLWNFASPFPSPSTLPVAPQGTLVYNMQDWSTGIGHITHANAKAGSAASQFACSSNANRINSPRVNELVCFPLDGSLNAVVVAPNMVDLNAPGGGEDYWKLPKANLDVTGEYMIWTANQGGGRQDAFLVRVPTQLLKASPAQSDTTKPTVAITSPGNGTNVAGSVAISAQALDNVGVTGVTIYLDGVAASTELTSSPYNAVWTSAASAAGTHVLTASARDAAGNVAFSAPVSVTVANTATALPTPPPSTSTSSNVVWASLVHAVVNGSTLQKSGGCGGCDDAGAISQQNIASGDGYLQFSLADVSALRVVGLTTGNPGTTMNGVKFGIRVQGGTAEVRESGTYRSDTRVANGDVLRVAVTNGKVQYSKNGTVFFTSAQAPTYPLIADASLSDASTAVNSATISSAAAAAAPSAPSAPSAPAASLSPAPVTWTNAVNVSVSGTTLLKNAGCDGCPDAGAISQQTLNGNGYLEFTASELAPLREIGLSTGNTGTSMTEIVFGLRLQGGYAEVRENGVYRNDTAFKTGDVFRVEVASGAVRYSRNGTVFYTSTVTPVFPLVTDTSFSNMGGTITNAVMAGSATANAIAPVAWTSLVKTSASGGVLSKSGGCDGCSDAGAISEQRISSGTGYVEFTVADASPLLELGLSNSNPSTTMTEILFGLRLQGGAAEVRESGSYRTDIAFKAGDIFRIAVSSGTIQYSKNGQVFYTSQTTATYPLMVDTALLSMSAQVRNAVIAGR